MEPYYISTDKDRLDIPKIHKEIKDSYWGGNRTTELTTTTIDNSICFGVYTKENEQIGFARVLTDKVVFAYIMDLMVFNPYKGKGIGKRLVEYILGHPSIKDVLTKALKTKDAHSLYEQYGFRSVGDSPLWMTIDNVKLN